METIKEIQVKNGSDGKAKRNAINSNEEAD